MKKQLNYIREIFWPLLDPIENDSDSEESEKTVIVLTDENLETAFDLGAKIFDAEEERRKSIESKAALLLGTISVASSIIVTASTLINGTSEATTGARLSVFVSAVVAIYAARTVWYSVKILGRGAYQVLSLDDINFHGTKNEYYRYLIAGLIQKTKENHPVINKKVDYLVLAQEYYKRAIIVIFVYAFAVLGFSLFPSKGIKKISNVHIDSCGVFYKELCANKGKEVFKLYSL